MVERCDVAVIGAGPAGLAAARTAAGHGARVLLLDAQPRCGGQVWRHDVAHRAPHAARSAIRAVGGKVDWRPHHQVVAADGRRLLAETPEGAVAIEAAHVVLATGARELLLPFPGWTLPGVTGAGGLQALAKQGWPLAGKRVLVAGSGPLLLAAAATLRRHGAEVLGIHEQASAARVAAFAAQLWRWPARALQAARLRAALTGVPYRCGSFVRRAFGTTQLEGVELHDAHGTRQIACDHLAVGYGLVPNIELAALLGCALDHDTVHPRVQADELLRTSVPGVLAAGEAVGVAGLAAARIEGALAGHVAGGNEAAARALRPARVRARRFAALLARQFALDPRLRALADAGTIVCRCEDVPLAALDGCVDARSARLVARCGMGACQGRICGAALAELGRFPRGGLRRPPLFPARLATLAAFLQPTIPEIEP
ncbi:FAD/NAD(P)-binding oxidoreductase [Fulvimonas sp. R45]|uniref:NAD(P)/FAD-dependent oxidoreductase n=1 Tax=Fulvimonas sp. R45 TaxID=3045937 RepID=UPI00265F5972|nr:FAD/NAD(P)-binding oxidoreductase [Fulvimonas sp. R45]MDO1529361.1 FAD/NAD(P)-binding oxidoreductase [Fulvimonas sp. R45]